MRPRHRRWLTVLLALAIFGGGPAAVVAQEDAAVAQDDAVVAQEDAAVAQDDAAVAQEDAAAAQDDAAADDPALIPYYNGNALCKRHLYTAAIAQYEAFLEASPEHAKAPLAKWGLAIATYSRFYNYDAAGRAKHRADAQKAAALFAELAQKPAVKDQELLHNFWGACLLGLDDFAKAEKAFAWTAKNGKDPAQKLDATAGLAQALYLQDKWARVVEVTDALLKAAPDSSHAPEARYQGAVARRWLERYDEADAILTKLLKETADPSLKHRSTYFLAECRWSTKKLADAAALYEAAAKTDRGIFSEHAHLTLGITQFRLKAYDKAVAELTEFVAKHPKSGSLPRANLYLGRAYLEAKDHAKAEAALEPLLEAKGVAGPATLWLARTYARQNKHADVEALLTPAVTALAKDPVLRDLQYELAMAQMGQDKFKAAAAAYGAARAGADDALATEALRLQAFCLHRDTQYAESLKLCDAFVAAHPKHPEAGQILFIKAENMTFLGTPDAALPVYEKVLAANPDHRRGRIALFRMAQTHYAKQNWQACLEKLGPLLKGPQADAVFDQIWYMAGACHFRLDAWDQAVPALEKFVGEKPRQPNVDTAMYNLSLAYQHQKQPAKAAAILGRLVETFPKSRHTQEALIELGRLQYEAKEYAAAKETLLKVGADGPPAAQYYLGWIALTEKNDTEAAARFAAMAGHPKHPFAADAALQHAILLIRAGEHEEADTILTGLLANYPAYAKKDQAVYYKGLALARQKLYAKAVPQFVTVLTTYPKSEKADKALYWQAWCRRSAGEADAAAKLYASFLATFPKSALAGDVTVELSELEFERQQKLPVVKPEAKAAAKKTYTQIATRLAALLGPKTDAVPDSPLRNRALYVLGWCRFRLAEHGKAAVTFETLLASKHKNTFVPSALFQAGEARMKLREHGPALEHFTKAVAAGKTAVHEAALLRRAQCEALNEKWEGSQASAELFLETYPKSKYLTDAQFSLGWALENQGEHAKAIPVYRKVTARRQVDEISARCQFQIGECLFVTEQYDAAIPELVIVETRYGFPKWTSKAVLELGRVLEAQGKKKEAAERYREVKKRFPKTAAADVAENLLKKLGANE